MLIECIKSKSILEKQNKVYIYNIMEYINKKLKIYITNEDTEFDWILFIHFNWNRKAKRLIEH